MPADEWDPLLERLGVDDAYLLRDYVRASALIEPGDPVLLHLPGPRGDVVAAYLVRPLPGGVRGCDLITPYGYGGPVAAGPAPPADLWPAAMREWAEGRGAVTAFIRFHPLYGNHRLAGHDVELRELAGTVGWRLDAGRDLEAEMHRRRRRAARAARAAGVRVRVEEAPGDLAGFVDVYEATMRRRGARDVYLFPPDYWRAFEGPLRPRVVLVEGLLDGAVASALLCLRSPRVLHYHLGGSSEEGLAASASSLCFLEAARWGQSRGLALLHLGGGVGGGEDTLHEFKRSFDPAAPLHPMHVGRQVIDPARYRQLAGTDATSGFFPAYRAAGS